MEIRFDCKVATPLCEIMERNKSDKGSTNITQCWHNYTPFYYSLFKDLKEKPLRIFELGIGSQNPNFHNNMGAHGRPGASLYGWKEFFPNAQIYGADIDTDILFKDERIQTFFCDATNPSIIQNMWRDPRLEGTFDIIIDDGLHEATVNTCFLLNSLNKLAENGYYIIEDVYVDNRWDSLLPLLSQLYSGFHFTLVKIPNTFNTCFDNNLIVIQKKTNPIIKPIIL
jgi:hypothetical protein